jgi:hypothetical protein
MPYLRGTKFCAHSGCGDKYYPHEWGTKEAQRKGWFLQRNGVAWCPDHNPDWVAEWRVKNKKKNQDEKELKALKHIMWQVIAGLHEFPELGVMVEDEEKQ